VNESFARTSISGNRMNFIGQHNARMPKIEASE